MNYLTNEQTLLIDILKMATSKSNKEKLVNELMVELPEIDWPTFYKISKEQGVFPFVYNTIKNHLPSEIFPIFSEEYESHIQRIDLRINELKKVTELANKHNIHLVVSKGVVFSKLIYDDVYGRKAGDIDTYLSEKDVPVMHSLLLENGYFHRAIIRNKEVILPYPVLKYCHSHHEYWGYITEASKQELVCVELQRFILNKITHRMKDFLNGFKIMEFQGVYVKTFDIEHSLLLLIVNTYVDSEWFHGGPRLKSYLDICSYCNKFAENIDWDRIYSLSVKYNIIEVVYRVLVYVNDILHNFIDTSTIQLFESDISEKLFFEWDIPIQLRLFQNKLDHENSIKKQLINRCFSYNNPNFIAPKIVNFTGSDYEQFIDYKYEFITQFRFKISSSCLIIELHLEQRFIDIMENFMIDIVFISEDSLYKYAVFITKNEGSVKAINQDETEIMDCIINMTSELTCEISIPFTIIGVEMTDLPIKLAYNVNLCERKYKNVLQIISSHWYFDLDYWKSPPIIQLQK